MKLNLSKAMNCKQILNPEAPPNTRQLDAPIVKDDLLLPETKDGSKSNLLVFRQWRLAALKVGNDAVHGTKADDTISRMHFMSFQFLLKKSEFTFEVPEEGTCSVLQVLV